MDSLNHLPLALEFSSSPSFHISPSPPSLPTLPQRKTLGKCGSILFPQERSLQVVMKSLERQAFGASAIPREMGPRGKATKNEDPEQESSELKERDQGEAPQRESESSPNLSSLSLDSTVNGYYVSTLYDMFPKPVPWRLPSSVKPREKSRIPVKSSSRLCG